MCEEGEGTAPSDRDNPESLEKIKESFAEVSTEVELIAENTAAIHVLMHSVEFFDKLTLAPELDTKKRFLAKFRKPQPFPATFASIAESDLERYRISVLR